MSFNGKGKERLILDLRHVNKHVRLDKFKFEDWKTLKQYINLNSYGFVFDLKSGYHHVDIHKSFQTYLGFSWEINNVVKYFVFTVLPFGLKSSAYIFSKVLRPLVKFWRSQSIKLVLYLDDGFAVSDDLQLSSRQAIQVKSDLISSGLVTNKDKSIWTPVQSLEWLGFVWNLTNCTLSVPERKLFDLQELISIVLQNCCKIRARNLAKVCDKIIAMSPALGHVTQIMTRCMFSVLNEKSHWNQILNIAHKQDCVSELLFWKSNILKLEPQFLLQKSSSYNLYTDASNSAAARFIENFDLFMHKPWLPSEASKSSTWREIKALELCVLAFLEKLRGSTVTFYTDSQNAASIILKGSRVPELQVLALTIFNSCRKNKIDIYSLDPKGTKRTS